MKQAKQKFVVISGCSSGGKSTLLAKLNAQGYTVIPEAGRVLVKEQLQTNGDITPWQNPVMFCEELIRRSIAAYQQAELLIASAKDHLIFFDRSFLDGISYYQTLLEDDKKYDHFIDDLRFYPTVFMAPPWREIFIQDEERRHSFEDAASEYNRLLKSYTEFGYQVVEIPKKSVEERTQFLLTSVSKYI